MRSLSPWREMRGPWREFKISIERMKDVGHAVLALVAFEVTAPGGIKPPTCGQLVTCQLVTYKHGAANRTENSATWEQALQVTRLAG